MLAERAEVVAALADGVAVEIDEDGERVLVVPTARDRISALKLMADIGMGAAVTMADVRERLKQQAVVIRARLGPEIAESLLTELSGVWK